MESPKTLKDTLEEVDGTGYGAYKKITGSYDFGEYELHVDHVQGNPYASPSKFRVRVPGSVAGIPEEFYRNRDRRRGLEDYLTRAFDRAIRKHVEGHRGSGKSGLIANVKYGQAALDRTAMYEEDDGSLEARFVVGLPAKGRTPMSAVQARLMLFEEIPTVVEFSLFFENLSSDDLREHVESVEDSAWIRRQLPKRDLVAFVADGSELPRESGIGDRPIRSRQEVVPFQSPESMRVSFSPPNRDPITGMGIPEGITLIVGGGYHGKSTLLNALAHGVYDHVPGDGRELVVSRRDTVTARAEDGRSVRGVNIGSFIRNVPTDIDTEEFTSDDASGSTSQAAGIVEQLEAGAGVFLIDEDVSATNFLIRDERMQKLVSEEDEPITPLIHSIERLRDQHDVSVIMVMGGSGDYFDVADQVVQMDTYRPYDVTKRAQEICEELPRSREYDAGSGRIEVSSRCPDPDSINPRKGGSGKVKIRSRAPRTIEFGEATIDLSAVMQISEEPQTRAIGDALNWMARNVLDRETSLNEGLEVVEQQLEEGKLHEMIPYPPRNYARPRRYELAAALNRLRLLEISRASNPATEEKQRMRRAS